MSEDTKIILGVVIVGVVAWLILSPKGGATTSGSAVPSSASAQGVVLNAAGGLVTSVQNYGPTQVQGMYE